MIRECSRRGSGAAVLLVLALTAGCAPTLRPAPEAQRVPGRELAAITENAGVSMVVEAGAWDARPKNLDRELTPLPPLKIEGTVTERADRPILYARYAIRPRFAHSGFYIAPWYAPYYVGMRPWAYSPWAYNPIYYDTYYPRWTVKLPTADMLELAIPEGVIEPGGSLSGYLYFPQIDDDAKRLIFGAQLMEGRSGMRLGALEVPFEIG